MHQLKGPYVFGVDPIWNFAENHLTFTNSMKMKISIVIGITQMAFGISLSLLNHIHSRSLVDVLFMFVPQALFLGSIFGYLCIQVISKWILFGARPVTIFGWYYPGSHCAPSLLIGFINMFMMKKRERGFWNTNSNAQLEKCYLQLWYPNQELIEKILLTIAMVCIPVMLLAKPIIKNISASRTKNTGDDTQTTNQPSDFPDLMVHQAIHTIEFALGCISHTASYLRLWALSLAHAQLSEVLWSMVLGVAFRFDGLLGAIVLFVTFFAFAILSVAILVLMEGLSAFLHALRLHWVEFQSKFYFGQGYSFVPFKFAEFEN